ncbi:MAG: hypothetical protein MI784_13325 [Cytophagales bacterium]|nr:hypothetical protein [Cytophagales bacterium]
MNHNIFNLTSPFENEGTSLIGQIVALKSHPFTNEKGSLFQGDDRLLSPLMVIKEIVKEEGNQPDPKTEIKINNSHKYLCLYFCQEKKGFEEKWIASDFLELIPVNNEKRFSDKKPSEQKLPIAYGDTVRFITSSLEFNKKRLLFNNNEDFVHRFVPPILQIKNVFKNEENHPLKKNGKIIRKRAQYLAKCIWFNTLQSKVSECIVPLAALEMLQKKAEINFEKVYCAKIKRAIHIIKPKQWVYKNGEYFIYGNDYISDKPQTIPSHQLRECVFELTNINKGKLLTLDLIRKTLKINQLFQIQYRNRKGEISKRIIKVKDFFDEHGSDCVFEKSIFIHAQCYKRNENRFFKLERILEIQKVYRKQELLANKN